MISTGVRTALPLCGFLISCVAFGQTSTVWVRPGHYKELKPDRLIHHMNELPAAVESLMAQNNSSL